MRRFLYLLPILTLTLPALTWAADQPDAKGAEFFEKKIRPVLVEHCYQCHSADADKNKKLKGGLLLDTREGLRKGGDTGPALTPGKPRDSLLLQALRHDGPEMPPKKKLPDTIIADFTQWVTMGAPDPRDGKVTVQKGIDIEAGRKHWAFQPVRQSTPPTAKHMAWVRSDVDRYLLVGIETAGLKPVRDADKAVILRRVYFDLIGLPPSPEDTDGFVKDESPDALAKVIDRLLASPQFGERWGRHWLDVAHYAESNGNADNLPFPHAYRYRDYVIASFNADKPYDRFVTEQLAGDLLPAADAKQKNEQLIATGFLAMTSKPRAQNNPNYEMDLVADQVEVTTSALLGLTVACARCHDHKFDPVPQKEFYSLAGFFTSSQMLHGGTGGKGVNVKKGPGPGGLHALDGVADGFAMGVRDGKVGDTQLCVRGESQNKGETVRRGYITVATLGTPPEVPAKQSGRLELAKWITDSKHPLTARVFVNRVWAHLFGKGLVGTVDNFGNLGERPSHPELLDYLASRFVEEGWSVKKLIRSLMLTHAYRLSSEHDDANLARDPTNRLVWRMNLRRLEAEAIRDAVLAAGGSLILTPPTGSVAVFSGNKRVPAVQKDHNHRSVYLPIVRASVPEILSVFDFADPTLVIGDREVTTVPAQSLYLLNSPFVVEQARAMAKRVQAADGDAERITLAYKIALARPPSTEERERVRAYLSEKPTAEAWTSFCQALMATAEFRYLR